MMRSAFRHALLLLSLCLAAAPVLAHETWVSPSVFRAKVGEPVRLDVTSGKAFPKLERAVTADRVAKAAYRLAAGETALADFAAGETALSVTPSFAKEGLATIWFELKPRQIELADDLVAGYLDKIRATQEVRAGWAAQRGKVPWRETYAKFAKTFVGVGSAASDGSWSQAVDAELELVPQTNPAEVRVGSKLTVRLLSRSKPLPGLSVGLWVEGQAGSVFAVTDAEGRATFPVTQAGRAMLHTVRLVQNAGGKDWKSDFCTLTLEVKRAD